MPTPKPTAPEDVVVKPTPTQEENDLAAMGMSVVNKEQDGSPFVSPVVDEESKKQQVRKQTT